MIGVVLILIVAWATLKIEKRYGTVAAIVVGGAAILALTFSGVWNPSPVLVDVTVEQDRGPVTPPRVPIPPQP